MHIKSGLYRHYKGNDYYVFQVAQHSESDEYMVVYQYLYDDFGWSVRPLSLFVDQVEVAGEMMPRFSFVREISADELAVYNRPTPTQGNECV